MSFVEARSVFLDEHGRLIDDPEHSDSEDRFILLGMSMASRVLVVVHAYRDKAAVVRIISARRATPAERAWYERGGKS